MMAAEEDKYEKKREMEMKKKVMKMKNRGRWK